MIKLIKYELYKNKLFLLLTTIITLVFGALPLPIAINGSESMGLNYVIPLLVILFLVYGIGIGMIIFIILQQRELWNNNGILLYSLPISRFKIFASKIITGLFSTLFLLSITLLYAFMYIKILDGTDFVKEIIAYVPSDLAISTTFSVIGNWLYWVMTITFLIVLSKTILGHNSNKGWIIPLIGVFLIIVLPVVVSLVANHSLITTSLQFTEDPDVQGDIASSIQMGSTVNFIVSIAFNWLMSIGMFISSGMLIKKKLNI